MSLSSFFIMRHELLLTVAMLMILIAEIFTAQERKGYLTTFSVLLMAAITAYTDERCSVGTAPLVLSRDIILKLTEMLKALNHESAAGVLDASNALIKSVLDVSNITSEYLTRNE